MTLTDKAYDDGQSFGSHKETSTSQGSLEIAKGNIEILEGSRENCEMQFGDFQAAEKLEKFSGPVKSMPRHTLKRRLHWGWG